MDRMKNIIKAIKLWFIHSVMLRFHSHDWEYEQDNWQTIRTCKKCGVKHVNKHIVSQIYGGEHWYDYNEA